ncbi:tyrosine-type recombinase/integrase [Micromonospora sp. WMMD812]|nr:tyrosine-type recombinase/integrase [Micromonospora sp. WMMD812]WBB69325.1 tyrosine-type recombinase/integrase [Micromonospora sp. WMMD812]
MPGRTTCQRRRLHLSLPQRLRGLRLGHQARRAAHPEVRLRQDPRGRPRQVDQTAPAGQARAGGDHRAAQLPALLATSCEKTEVTPITVHDARRTCATLLAALDVHPRVAMQVLRHARFSVTMEIYTQVSSKATREALKRLGDSLGH